MTGERSRRGVLALVLLVLALVTAVLVVGLGDDEYSATPPADVAAGPRPAEAATVVQRLAQALGDADPEAAAALAPPDDAVAARLLADVAVNVERLRVRDLTLRFVDVVGGVDAAGRWQASVDLTWRLGGLDEGTARQELLVGLVNLADGVAVRSLGVPAGVEPPLGAESRTPLWLTAPVLVSRTRDALVYTTGDQQTLDRYAGLARRAVPAVRAALPTTGSLVVTVPASATGLDRVLGVPDGTYGRVAAVTAHGDGIVARSSPVHVFVNPSEVARLARVGAQVVLTHEAVHALTDAPSSRAPLWLVEGFADWVALQDVDLPLTRTARQVRERVREQGVPVDLPGPEQFDVTGTHLGAAYEAAWLACVTLAEQVGDDGLVRVYRLTGRGESLETALDRVGGSRPALVEAWQERLRDLPEG